MIKIENVDTFGWKAAIRGMRNPMNSWDKSDSYFGCDEIFCIDCPHFEDGECGQDPILIGENDLKLMNSLAKAGSDHGKFLRMINVTCDITAPLYWWKEFDTYKVGTVANSCSTMHKITSKRFTLDDFSHEHLTKSAFALLEELIENLNDCLECYADFENCPTDIWEVGITCKKDIWWQIIQLLPTSYNQRRTVQLNYQVLKSMYLARKQHKLDEWRDFCIWCETLPYFKEVCIDA